ncbi:glycosyltransferase [Acidicapsa acidisoli]|uniref:glycosyltransferase n=1 Tax=Acidicapsa acidisoli TaxID=1615681 RepID=UPI0021E04054|nr:nucleotide disphospho-sugar-binding domain-containing protein [Acidicapsa acidisoli]
MATIGSLGDLHPTLALALELKRRGHLVTVASTGYYRDKVEALGLTFRALRPNWDPTDQNLIAQCEDLKSGPEVLFRKLILPHLRDTYDDLLAAAAEADLMIAGELVYAAPLVAEKLRLQWGSAILSPTSFFSAHDPSYLVNIPEVYRLRRAGWGINRAILEFGKLLSRHWWEPVRSLRRELGLRVACDPVFKDKFSPDLVLALFSSCLGAPQPDWPRHTLQPGFVFYDRHSPHKDDSPELADFLAAGDAPIVFTLGSTAVHNSGDFYDVSMTAARQLGRRGVFVGAKSTSTATSADFLALLYAPYSRIFPGASVIVHQGGSGTTGQALRAGRPQLIVPYGWDQPDNGARVERLGVGLCLARSAYSVQSAVEKLSQLLADRRFVTMSAEAGARIRKEDSLRIACDAIEALLDR